MDTGTLGLAFLAGILSILSPCVLPLLPVIMTAAVAEHRLAPFALAAGLALSFTVLALFVALIGFSIGLDSEFFRGVAAVLFLALGAILIVPRFQTAFAVAAGPVGDLVGHRLVGFSAAGVGGQFILGLVLGAVWVPCVGPTLGVATVLAARGEDLPAVAATMIALGLGAAAPLVLLGLVSRQAVVRWRVRLIGASRWLRTALGIFLVVLGTGILTGLDRVLETALVDASPAWLTELTTRY